MELECQASCRGLNYRLGLSKSLKKTSLPYDQDSPTS